jgi:hypothetical protein
MVQERRKAELIPQKEMTLSGHLKQIIDTFPGKSYSTSDFDCWVSHFSIIKKKEFEDRTLFILPSHRKHASAGVCLLLGFPLRYNEGDLPRVDQPQDNLEPLEISERQRSTAISLQFAKEASDLLCLCSLEIFL